MKKLTIRDTKLTRSVDLRIGRGGISATFANGLGTGFLPRAVLFIGWPWFDHGGHGLALYNWPD